MINDTSPAERKKGLELLVQTERWWIAPDLVRALLEDPKVDLQREMLEYVTRSAAEHFPEELRDYHTIHITVIFIYVFWASYIIKKSFKNFAQIDKKSRTF